MLLSDDLAVIATTPAAERWLEELVDRPCAAELPQSVLELQGFPQECGVVFAAFLEGGFHALAPDDASLQLTVRSGQFHRAPLQRHIQLLVTLQPGRHLLPARSLRKPLNLKTIQLVEFRLT